MEPCKLFRPPVQGGYSIYFSLIIILIYCFHVLEVGEKFKSKFSNLSPLPNGVHLYLCPGETKECNYVYL